jgi:hypothetical protein
MGSKGFTVNETGRKKSNHAIDMGTAAMASKGFTSMRRGKRRATM